MFMSSSYNTINLTNNKYINITNNKLTNDFFNFGARNLIHMNNNYFRFLIESSK